MLAIRLPSKTKGVKERTSFRTVEMLYSKLIMTHVTDTQIKPLIHQSNLLEGFDSAEMDVQGLLAWHVLRNLSYDQLDNDCIKKIQCMITLPQTDLNPEWRGEYRAVPVWIGGQEAVAPEHVQAAMDDWLAKYQYTHPRAAHIEFEKIHPFADGNGRTGRLLMWWQQMHRDDPLTKITHAKRQDYYDWFND